MSKPPLPTVVFHFDLQQLYDARDIDVSDSLHAQKLGELVDFASREFKGHAVMETRGDSSDTAAKGAFVMITELLITAGLTAKAVKPLIESIAILIDKLNQRFPNNKFDVTGPHGFKIHLEGRVTAVDVGRLTEEIITQVRRTDLSAPNSDEKATYLIALRRRNSDVR